MRKVGGAKKRKRKGERACNHFFKRPVPVYQLLVYPFIGQIWQIISTVSKRVVPLTQKDGVRRPRAWNRRIHGNFCVERMFTRFIAHRSAEEGTEDLPRELGARKKCFCNPADRLRSCLITKWQQQISRKKKSRLTLSKDLFRKTGCCLKITA